MVVMRESAKAETRRFSVGLRYSSTAKHCELACFTAAGLDVFLLGPIPTPAVAMLTRSLRADVGVMISASHNPFADNGIKLFGPDGYKMSDEIEARIEALIDRDNFHAQLARSHEIGRATVCRAPRSGGQR